jgi:hypothetical protein
MRSLLEEARRVPGADFVVEGLEQRIKHGLATAIKSIQNLIPGRSDCRPAAISILPKRSGELGRMAMLVPQYWF